MVGGPPIWTVFVKLSNTGVSSTSPDEWVKQISQYLVKLAKLDHSLQFLRCCYAAFTVSRSSRAPDIKLLDSGIPDTSLALALMSRPKMFRNV